MSEQATRLKAENFLRIGDHNIRITEPVTIPTVVVDAFCDLRMSGNNTIALGLVTIHRDGDGEPEARVCARLRVSLETLADIQRVVGQLVADATAAKGAAN